LARGKKVWHSAGKSYGAAAWCEEKEAVRREKKECGRRGLAQEKEVRGAAVA
jgi:hypothetical protein